MKRILHNKKKNPLTKVIFLDHDGCLSLSYDFEDLINLFNPSCVEILNEIILDTKAEIVISSDWRLHYDLRALQDIYRNEGIIRAPFDVTPDFYDKKMNLRELEELRTKEILWWLSKYNVDRWCAVDDMELNLKNFVHTDDQKGLMTKGVKKEIIRILNS